MTIFEDRERAFEQIFAHDEEARFRTLARRNKMLGEWAAGQLDLSGERADRYTDDVRKSVVAANTDDRLIRKIQEDFAANGLSCSEEQIRDKMGELMAKATAQVRTDEWKSSS